jgi:hypothetical protein
LPTLDDLLQQALIGDDEIADRIQRTRLIVERLPDKTRPAVFEELIARLKHYEKTTHLLRTDHAFRSELRQMPIEVDNYNLERKWQQALTRCYLVLLREYGSARIDRIDPECEQLKMTERLLLALTEINTKQLHVYTTNYDCSYQVLARNCRRLVFLSHINSQNARFTKDWHLRSQEAKPRAPRIYLHRLHGCVEWFEIPLETASIRSRSRGIDIREVCDPKPDRLVEDGSLQRMCIKLVASQLVGTPVFSTVFDEFRSHLRAAQVLLVWGYSFRDSEVVRRINDAVSERGFPVVLYLDPFLSESRTQEHIQLALSTIPVVPSASFKPRRINWVTSEGFETLVCRVEKAVKGVLEHGQETEN